MRTLFLAFVLFLASNVVAKPLTAHMPVIAASSFVPDNDLWREDNVNFVSAVDEQMFNRIIDIALEVYAPTAEQWNETLNIKRNWTNSTVNANATRDGNGWTEINMYGGLARRNEVTPYGFALVLCHEINHLYGGEPYIEPSVHMAAESQADYMGAGWCLKNVIDRLGPTNDTIVTPYIKSVCGGDWNCESRLAAGNSLGTLLAVLSRDPIPNYETPDKKVVKKTNLSYPSTQCRLDNYRAGVLVQARNLCWYKP